MENQEGYDQMNRKLALFLCVAACLAALGLSGCGKKDDAPAPATATQPAQQGGVADDTDKPADPGNAGGSQQMRPADGSGLSGMSFAISAPDLSRDGYATCGATLAISETATSGNVQGIAAGSYAIEQLEEDFDAMGYIAFIPTDGEFQASKGILSPFTFSVAQDGGQVSMEYRHTISEPTDTDDAIANIAEFTGIQLQRSDLSAIGDLVPGWMEANGQNAILGYIVTLQDDAQDAAVKLTFTTEDITIYAIRTFG